MTERRFYTNDKDAEAALPSREVLRTATGLGRVIVFETMEEVFFEARTPPYQDWSEVLPILRIICESDSMVQVGALQRRTLVVEGLSDQGVVLERRELIVDDTEIFGGNFGRSVGHRFDRSVKRVRVAGWWVEPKP